MSRPPIGKSARIRKSIRSVRFVVYKRDNRFCKNKLNLGSEPEVEFGQKESILFVQISGYCSGIGHLCLGWFVECGVEAEDFPTLLFRLCHNVLDFLLFVLDYLSCR